MGRDTEDRLKRWLAYGAQLALTVLVTWFIVESLGPGMGELRSLDRAVWRPDLPLLALSCVVLLAGYFASAALWGLIVVDLGGPRLPLAQVVQLFMVANLGRYLPGKVWQIAGLAVLARGRGVPAAVATGAAVLGQGVSLVAATLVGVLALAAGPEELRAWGLAGAGLLGVAVALGLIPPVFRWAVGLWFRLARQEPPRALGSGHALVWLVLFAANWVVYALSFWILAASFGHSGDLLPVASAFAAAYVLGYLMIFAPAGVGVREASLVALLTPYMGPGASGVLAVVARIWTTVVELVPAGLFWMRTMGKMGTTGGGRAQTSSEDADV
ncbi:MAG TPA: lysylphosphatidylglycerol synthase transmembrane domain-containing protein [Longimicrobiales bacterium]|nr:lysylphosphatidylglycerol synthase transmembrane domain-containing protein [Longimicrobiales bacterium]